MSLSLVVNKYGTTTGHPKTENIIVYVQKDIELSVNENRNKGYGGFRMVQILIKLKHFLAHSLSPSSIANEHFEQFSQIKTFTKFKLIFFQMVIVVHDRKKATQFCWVIHVKN